MYIESIAIKVHNMGAIKQLSRDLDNRSVWLKTHTKREALPYIDEIERDAEMDMSMNGCLVKGADWTIRISWTRP